MQTDAIENPDPSSGEWPKPDVGILADQRNPVPLPGHLPGPWGTWIAESQQMTGAPADYVLQAMLAAVAGLCGAGVRVRVTPSWDEPLVLWQALVGEPSTGKSAALAPVRRLVETLEQDDRRTAPGAEAAASPRGQILADDADPATVAAVVAGHPPGALLWRDGARRWIGNVRNDRHHAFWLAAWAGASWGMDVREGAPSRRPVAVSILETMRPDRLSASLCAAEESLATRFLFAWPGRQPYRPLTLVKSAREDDMRRRLSILSKRVGTPEAPLEVTFDANAVAALNAVSRHLHDVRHKAGGLEAAWLGKAQTFIVRLAGVIHMLSTTDDGTRPGRIGGDTVEQVAKLWRDYYWPHARSVFNGAGATDFDRRVRRVARWLRDTRPTGLSREIARRLALSQQASAEETESVLQRLCELGFLKPDPAASVGGRGRPTSHWLVNPGLAEVESPTAKIAQMSEFRTEA